jgi:hypothetical protein
VEQWLRRAANAAAEQELADATAIYYRSLRADERGEDETVSLLSDAARRVSYDEPTTPRLRGTRCSLCDF